MREGFAGQDPKKKAVYAHHKARFQAEPVAAEWFNRATRGPAPVSPAAPSPMEPAGASTEPEGEANPAAV